MNVNKYIEYWERGAEEEYDVAELLLKKQKIRHALFLAHLGMEKILKACIVKVTEKMPPRIHNLVRLAELAKLSLSDEQTIFLRQFDFYQIEGRYPDSMDIRMSPESAAAKIQRAREIYQWIKNQL